MKVPSTALCLTLLAGLPGLALAQTAGSAKTVQATPMTNAQIQQSLHAEGYTNVQVTRHGKDHIDVTATKNGRTEKLAINPQTAVATPDNDND